MPYSVLHVGIQGAIKHDPSPLWTGTTDWFQIGKGVHQGCILSPCLFNLYAEYIMRNSGLEEAQAGIGWGTHVYLWRIHFDIWQN